MPPGWVAFSAGILGRGSRFGQGNPWGRVPFRKGRERDGGVSHFEVEGPLGVGPDLRRFRKKALGQPFFEGEGSLDVGGGFGPRAAHPVKK